MASEELTGFGNFLKKIGQILDPIIYSMLDMPIPWVRDLLMAVGGVGGFYLLVECHYIVDAFLCQDIVDTQLG